MIIFIFLSKVSQLMVSSVDKKVFKAKDCEVYCTALFLFKYAHKSNMNKKLKFSLNFLLRGVKPSRIQESRPKKNVKKQYLGEESLFSFLLKRFSSIF